MWRNLLGRFILGTLFVVTFGSLLAPSAYGQTFKVLHAFTNLDDGGLPQSGLTIEPGEISTALRWASLRRCFVFRMTNVNGIWVLTRFLPSRTCGGLPAGRVVFGPHGTLYGTTGNFGGGTCQGYGCGVVFTLNVPASVCRRFSCQWNENVIHDFLGTPDGESPYYVDPVFDAAGNLYGTTYEGGASSGGTVFQLTNSGGQWTENILYNLPAATASTQRAASSSMPPGMPTAPPPAAGSMATGPYMNSLLPAADGL